MMRVTTKHLESDASDADGTYTRLVLARPSRSPFSRSSHLAHPGHAQPTCSLCFIACSRIPGSDESVRLGGMQIQQDTLGRGLVWADVGGEAFGRHALDSQHELLPLTCPLEDAAGSCASLAASSSKLVGTSGPDPAPPAKERRAQLRPLGQANVASLCPRRLPRARLARQ
jgi:hypothetical protein